MIHWGRRGRLRIGEELQGILASAENDSDMLSWSRKQYIMAVANSADNAHNFSPSPPEEAQGEYIKEIDANRKSQTQNQSA